MPKLPEKQKMWIAYVNEIRQVTIIAKGAGEQVFKRGMKPKDPYVVFDAVEKAEYVVASADLHHTPRDARIAMLKLAREHDLIEEVDEDEDEDEDEEADEDDDEDYEEVEEDEDEEEEDDEYDEEEEEEEDEGYERVDEDE